MYHLSRHGRTHHTAEEIKRGLLLCLREKPLGDITVSDIYRVTGISRSTFYRLFDSPDDVLLLLCDEYKEKMTKAFAEAGVTDLDDLAMFFFAYSLQNHALLEALVNNHRHDLLDDLYSASTQYMSQWLEPYERSDKGASDYLTALLYSNMTSILITWVQHGRRESPAELWAHFKKYAQFMAAVHLQG